MRKHFKTNIKRAFTLAEVLITLAIIGVVASMTMPTLLSTGNDQAFVSKLIKINSTLSQAAIEAERKYGLYQDWGFTDGSNDAVNLVYTRFKSYLNVSLDCGNDSSSSTSSCFASDWTTYNNASPGWARTTYGLGGNVRAFKLKDGTSISIDGHVGDNDKAVFGIEDSSVQNNYPIIMVDVNGKKKPNKVGRDIFFFVMSTNGILPAGISNTNDCNKNGRCYSCAAKVLKTKKISFD